MEQQKQSVGELEAVIRYRSGNACFRILKDREGIYTASLLRYDGEQDQAPPEGIILVRGIRYWTGSVEDETLLNELGRCIETTGFEETEKNLGQ